MPSLGLVTVDSKAKRVDTKRRGQPYVSLEKVKCTGAAISPFSDKPLSPKTFSRSRSEKNIDQSGAISKEVHRPHASLESSQSVLLVT